MNLKSLTASEFVKLEVPQRRYVIAPFLPERGLIEVYARTGVGKTTFAIALALAAASGKSFQSWSVNRPWRILYIDGEMSTNEMQERVTATNF